MTTVWLLGLAGLLAVTGSARAQDDPLYRGRRLSQYVRALGAADKDQRVKAATALGEMRLPDRAVLEALTTALQDPSADVRQKAGAALAAIGPETIPYLATAMGHADPAVRTLAVSALGQLAPNDRAAVPLIMRALQNAESAVRLQAAAALARFGPAARAAVPALMQALQSPSAEERAAAVRALGSIGAPAQAAVGPLVNMLRENRRARAVPRILEVADALGRMGPAAREAVPALEDTLKEENPGVRLLTAWALLAIGAKPVTVIPALTALLDDRDLASSKEGPSLQAQAADLLGWIGPEARTAVAVLVRQMVATDFPAGKSALQALVRIGDPALPELIRALPQANELGQKRIILVVTSIGPNAVPVLLQTLDHPKPEIRAIAARALGQLGRGAQATVPRLEKALRDRTMIVRLSAAEALLRVDRGLNRQALQYLAMGLKDKDKAYRLGSLKILADLGPRERDAAPAFAALILDPDDEVSQTAARALTRLGGGNGPAIQIVKQAFEARDASRRCAAIATLYDLGADVLEVGPLMKALTDPDAEVRKVAALALGSCGPRAAEAVPALRKTLTDRNEGMRLAAVAALGRIGPAAQAALPDLMTEWQNPNAFQAVASALEGIGPPALPVLLPYLRDPRQPNRDKIARLVVDIAVAARSSVWSEVLADADPAVRLVAVEALEKQPASFLHCLGPTLAEMVRTDRDAEVCRRAVKVLGESGREAAPALRRLLRDPDAEIRMLAAAALTQWPEHAAAAVPVLLAGLKTRSKVALDCSGRGLSQMTHADSSAVSVLRTALQDPTDDVRLWAAIALGQMGSRGREAVPALRRALRDGDPQVRLAAADAWSRFERRPGEALPVLVTALERGDRVDMDRVGNSVSLTVQPGSALRRYGSTAVPALVTLAPERIRDLPTLRLRIAELLEELGPEAAAAVPSLAAALQEKQYQMPPRPKGSLALSEEEAVREALTAWVEGSFAEETIAVLGSIGPEARGAVAPLAEVLAGKNQALHAAATKALARIGPAAAAAVPALEAALRERGPVDERELRDVALLPPNARGTCFIFLFERNQWSPSEPWEFGLAASFEGAIPSDVRSQAAYALARIGPAARPAVPALREALRTRSSPVFPLVYALWRITGRSDEVVPELVDLLNEADIPGEEALLLLARIGPTAQGAVPMLRQMVSHHLGPGLDRPFHRSRDQAILVIQTLGWIGLGARPAVPDLEKLLHDEPPELRKTAALALWRIDRRARQAVPVLVELLQGGSTGRSASPEPMEIFPSVQAAAAEALGEIGPEAREAIPALRKALEDENALVRIAAAAALWRLEGDPATVPPVLLAALRDQGDFWARVALETLGRLGPRARAAIPAIEALLDHEDISLRRTAATALRLIRQDR